MIYINNCPEYNSIHPHATQWKEKNNKKEKHMVSKETKIKQKL